MRIKEIKDIVQLGKEKFGGHTGVLLCVFKHFKYDTKKVIKYLRDMRDIKGQVIRNLKLDEWAKKHNIKERKHLTLLINFYEREFKKYGCN